MKKILSTLFIFLLLSTSAFCKSGKGEIELSKLTMEYFLGYVFGEGKNLNANTGGSTDFKNRKSTPRLFVTDATGTAIYYNYCMFGDKCEASNSYRTISMCQKKYSNCFLFAKGKKIVWKNSKNPRGLNLNKHLKHGVSHVAQVMKDAGYYNGDITLLQGYQASVSKNSNSTSTFVKKKSSKEEKKKEITKKIVKKYELNGKRSIAMSWGGYSDLIAGTIEFNEVDYKGILNLALPNNDGTCDGTYSLQKGGKGTWQIACSNNLGAAGTLTWNKNGSVTGKGRDHKDNKVKFTVSEKI